MSFNSQARGAQEIDAENPPDQQVASRGDSFNGWASWVRRDIIPFDFDSDEVVRFSHAKKVDPFITFRNLV